MRAPASTRATDHVTFSFGLINIPLSVFTGTVSDSGVKRQEFTTVPVLDEAGNQKMTEVIRDDGTIEQVPMTEDHPVGRMAKDKVTEEPLPLGAEVVRKIDTEHGFVHVSEEEQEKLFSITPKSIVVREFQPLALFSSGEHYVPKSLYFVEPSKTVVGKKKVPNVQAQKLLAMVLAGMREEGVFAVVDFTTRGIPKPGVLLPDGRLFLVWHTDALREQRELEQVELNDALVLQARTLIQAQLGTTPLDLSDVRSELIQNFANEKAAAGDFGKPVEVEATAGQAAATDDADLMALLSLSVEAAKAEQAV